MKILTALCLTLLGFLPAGAAVSAEATPEATIRALYAADQSSIDGKDSGVIGKPKVRARFFSKAVLKALDADERAAAKRNEPPTIEGDPFTDSQEPGLKDLKIAAGPASADRGTVAADFDRGEGKRERLTYTLIREGGQWRIDDIAYDRVDGQNETLRGILNMK